MICSSNQMLLREIRQNLLSLHLENEFLKADNVN